MNVLFLGLFLFLAVAIFGGNCYRRDWLLYPAFNVLSWSYAFAVIAFILFGKIFYLFYILCFHLDFIQFLTFSLLFLGAAGILLYLESRKLYELRLEAKNLVAQMQHSQPEHALHQLRDQLQQQRHGWN